MAKTSAQEIAVPAPEVSESKLPNGVQMHDAGAYARATELPAVMSHDPRKPPPGWKGGFVTCGSCGDFIQGNRCPTCAPSHDVCNVQMSGPPKMMAR